MNCIIEQARHPEEKGFSVLQFLAGVSIAKLLYLVLVSLMSLLYPSFETSKALSIRQSWFPDIWMQKERSSLENLFATWDAEHYLYLAEYGYDQGVKSCAFYPLWPMAIYATVRVCGGSYILWGMILSNLFSLLGWCLFYFLARKRFGEAVARCSTLMLVLFPGSLFYQFIYTESLFFLLLMLLWHGMEHRKYLIAITAALLLPLTRGVGLFAIIPIGWHLLLLTPKSCLPPWKWISRERLRITDGQKVEISEYVQCFALILAPAAGWGLYLALMRYWTGNPLEGVEAQKYWGHVHSIGNLFNLPKFIQGWFDVNHVHDFHHSMIDRIAFFFVVTLIPALWWRCKDMLPWFYMLCILPAMSGTYTSYTRFLSVAFPIFLTLGWLAKESRRVRYLYLIVFVLIHWWLLWRFVNYRWAG